MDKIFINTPPFIPDALIIWRYRKKANGTLLYRIPSKKEQLIRVISHAPLFRPPIQKNLSFLNELAKDNKNLFLISSRFGFLRQATNKLVKKHRLRDIFQELYFNFDNKQPHLFKSEIINQLKLDKYIDDDLPLLKYVASKNNKVKLYWLNNKEHKKIAANITAITDIAEMVKE